jgi:hypothetical protein
MEDRRAGLTGGYVLLDALFTLFLAAVVVLSSLGVVSQIARRAAQSEALVRDEIRERSEYAQERKIVFIAE